MTEKTQKMLFGVLGLLTLSAAVFFRLYDLGMSAFRGDTILLWRVAQQHVEPALIWTKWFEVSGAAGQMPMPAYIMQVFLKLTNWNVTPFSARLPYAILGLLAVPVAYFAGRSLLGRGFGMLLAALVAVNPYHIAYSREAYFYSALFLGYFLYFWATVQIVGCFRAGGALNWKHLLLLALGLFFTAYSQITGMILCGAGGIVMAVMLLLNKGRVKFPWRTLLKIAAIYFIVLLPLVFVSWGLKPLLSQIGANREIGAQVVALSGETLLPGVGKALLRFSWGTSPGAVILLVVALAGAVWVMIAKKDRSYFWILCLIILQLILFALSRKAAGANYQPRYMSGIFPYYLALIAYGLWMFPRLLCRIFSRKKGEGWAVGVMCGIGISLCIYPSFLQTQVTGKPAPYYEIVNWTDSNLPAGTPVLADRWFESWNELKAHPTTNVFFTYTVPNEPLENFIKGRWRDTAKNFFRKYPDAAYLEIAKEYWDAPGVGPWPWPRQHFNQQVTFVNEAGLKLRNMGLATRGDYYHANTNRLVVELFYNTEEDVIAQAKEAGESVISLYGAGWKYAKTRDYRDWRLLNSQAEIRICNLTDQPLTVRPFVRAVCVGGRIRVRAKTDTMQVRSFPAGQVVEWSMDPMTLPPGITPVILINDMWNTAKKPLLIDQISASVVNNTQEAE